MMVSRHVFRKKPCQKTRLLHKMGMALTLKFERYRHSFCIFPVRFNQPLKNLFADRFPDGQRVAPCTS